MENIFNRYAGSKRVVGIGTGRTMEQLGEILPYDRTYICTSHQTALFLSGRPVQSAMNFQRADVYFDSTDFYDGRGNLIKGGAGGLTQEKLLVEMSDAVIIIADKSKYAEEFTNILVPVEIVPPSLSYFTGLLDRRPLGYRLRRVGGLTPFITDLGNFIVDVQFDLPFVRECKRICGVVEHGYFECQDKIVIEAIDD